MSGVTFVGSNHGGTVSATTATVPWPSGVQADDVAYLGWTSMATLTPTDPGGAYPFTLQASNSGAGGSTMLRILTRVCTGAETGNITLTSSGANKITGVVLVLRGVDTAHPIESGGVVFRVETVAGTTHAHNAVTSVAANAISVSFIAERSSSGTSAYTQPAGYTKRDEAAQTAGGMTITTVADDGLASGRPAGTAVTPGVWTSANGFSTSNVVTAVFTVPPASQTIDGAADATASTVSTAAGAVRERASGSTGSASASSSTGSARQRAGGSAGSTGSASSAGYVRQRSAATGNAVSSSSGNGLVLLRGSATGASASGASGLATITADAAAGAAASAASAALGLVKHRAVASSAASSSSTADGDVSGAVAAHATGTSNSLASASVRHLAGASCLATSVSSASAGVLRSATGLCLAVSAASAGGLVRVLSRADASSSSRSSASAGDFETSRGHASPNIRPRPTAAGFEHDRAHARPGSRRAAEMGGLCPTTSEMSLH